MTLALALALAMTPTEAQLLHGIAGVESGWNIHAPDGDSSKPICQRSVGQYQVTPRAVRELVRVGLLRPMRDFSLTNCGGIRKWLAVPRNNERAAGLYLGLMLSRFGGVEAGLCAYNGGRKPCGYADKVLRIVRGE